MATITVQKKEEVKAYVDEHKEVIDRDGIIAAQNLAEANAGIEQIKISERVIIDSYEGLVAYVRQVYQAQTVQAQDRCDGEREAQEKMDRDTRLFEAKETKRIAEAERRKHHVVYDWSKYRWFVAMEAVGFIAEASYNVVSMNVGGGSILFSITPAFIMAVSLCAFAIFLGTELRGKSSQEQRKLVKYFAGWMFVAFSALALLRSFAVFAEGSMAFSAETLTGAAVFVVIQALIFGGSVVVAMHLPSKADRLAKREHDRLSKEIKDADAVIIECKKASDMASSTADARRKERIDLVGEQSHLEAYIANLCRQSISAFYRELSLRKPHMKFDYSVDSMPLFQNK